MRQYAAYVEDREHACSFVHPCLTQYEVVRGRMQQNEVARGGARQYAVVEMVCMRFITTIITTVLHAGV